MCIYIQWGISLLCTIVTPVYILCVTPIYRVVLSMQSTCESCPTYIQLTRMRERVVTPVYIRCVTPIYRVILSIRVMSHLYSVVMYIRCVTPICRVVLSIRVMSQLYSGDKREIESRVTPKLMMVQGAKTYVSHVTLAFSRLKSHVTLESMMVQGAKRHGESCHIFI